MAIAWCFEDEATPFTEGALNRLSAGANVVVPALWPLEIANALLNAERRKRITAGQAAAFLHRVRGFDISIEAVHMGRAFDEVASIARQQGLSTYDAAYFELALRRAMPLATLDNDLRRAARASGISLVT